MKGSKLEKKKIEHALRLQEKAKHRERITQAFFVEFSFYFREWLYNLVARYKKRHVFPAYPMFILPSYYSEQRDKEIAAFAALQIKTDSEFSAISEYQELLGQHPWEWFCRREFVALSLGEPQTKMTGGVENWKISQYMNALWEKLALCNWFGEKTSYHPESLGCFFLGDGYDVMVTIGELAHTNDPFRVRMLRLILGATDGIGLGLWDIPPSALRCPLSKEMIQLLKAFVPVNFIAADADKIIGWLGFEHDYDFLYAYLGYLELWRRNPIGCSRMMSMYHKWFDKSLHVRPYKWRDILVDIPF